MSDLPTQRGLRLAFTKEDFESFGHSAFIQKFNRCVEELQADMRKTGYVFAGMRMTDHDEVVTDAVIVVRMRSVPPDPDWKDLLMKVLECFGTMEGTWCEHDWESFGITEAQAKLIADEYERLHPKTK